MTRKQVILYFSKEKDATEKIYFVATCKQTFLSETFSIDELVEATSSSQQDITKTPTYIQIEDLILSGLNKMKLDKNEIVEVRSVFINDTSIVITVKAEINTEHTISLQNKYVFNHEKSMRTSLDFNPDDRKLISIILLSVSPLKRA